MFTSPIPASPSLRRRPFFSFVRRVARTAVQQPLSERERELLRDRLELEHRARREADSVRREVELARAQAHNIIH